MQLDIDRLVAYFGGVNALAEALKQHDPENAATTAAIYKWHRSAHPASGADQAEQGQPQTADQGDLPVQPGGQRRLAGRERGERGHNRGHNRQRRNGELLTPSR